MGFFGIFGPKTQISVIEAIESYVSSNDISETSNFGKRMPTTLQKERDKVTSFLKDNKAETALSDQFDQTWEEYEKWKLRKPCCNGIEINYENNITLEQNIEKWNELKSKILAYSSGIPIIGRVINKIISIEIEKVNDKMPSKQEIKRIKDRDRIVSQKNLKEFTQEKLKLNKIITENKGLTPEFMKYTSTGPEALRALEKQYNNDKKKIFKHLVDDHLRYINAQIKNAEIGKSNEQYEIDEKITLINFLKGIQQKIGGVKGGMRTRKYRRKNKRTRRC